MTWFLETFSVADAGGLLRLAAEAPPGCDGLLFLPALSGAMAPRWIAAARAGFYGADRGARQGGISHARCSKGCAFAMRDVVDRLDALGLDTGRCPADRRRRAAPRVDADPRRRARRPVEALAAADTSAVGAAVLAAVACGEAASVGEACGRLRLPVRVVEPRAGNLAAHARAYRRYRALFEALAPTFGEG